MAKNPTGKTRHFVALDGLRGVAAIVVVLYHCRHWINPATEFHGYLAVDFFFLLSGFVISHAYGAKIASGTLSFTQFAVSRIIRLYPMIVLGAIMGTAAIGIEGIEKHWLGLFVRAAAALPFALLALPQPFLKEPFLPNGPVWSLFFELIANIAYFFVLPRLRMRWTVLIAIVLGLALVEPIRAYGQVTFGWLWPTMALGFLRVGFPFTVGVALQRLHEKDWLRIPSAPVWMLAPFVAGLLAMPIIATWRGELLYTFAALFVIFPLIVACASNDEPSSRWSGISKLSAEISYPLYLTHYPIITVLNGIPRFAAMPISVRLAFAIGLCIAVSLIVSRYYDRRLRGWLGEKQAARRKGVDVFGSTPPSNLTA